MVLRSGSRKLSFDLLTTSTSFECVDDNALFYRSNSDPPIRENEGDSQVSKTNRRKPKNKGAKKKKNNKNECCSNLEESVVPNAILYEKSSNEPVEFLDCKSLMSSVVVCQQVMSVPLPEQSGGGSICRVISVTGSPTSFENLRGGGDAYSTAELRQRTVMNRVGGSSEEVAGVSRTDDTSVKESDSSLGKQRAGRNGNVATHRKLEKEESLDWKCLMAEDPNYFKYSNRQWEKRSDFCSVGASLCELADTTYHGRRG